MHHRCKQSLQIQQGWKLQERLRPGQPLRCKLPMRYRIQPAFWHPMWRYLHQELLLTAHRLPGIRRWSRLHLHCRCRLHYQHRLSSSLLRNPALLTRGHRFRWCSLILLQSRVPMLQVHLRECQNRSGSMHHLCMQNLQTQLRRIR